MRLRLPATLHKPALGGLASSLAVLALSACGVASSDRIDYDAPFEARIEAGAPQCESTLGYYALPKDYLHVLLTQTGVAAPELAAAQTGTQIGATKVSLLKHPDPKLTFCLDHLNNPLAKDKVKVTKSLDEVASAPDPKARPSTPYLQKLSFNVTDESSVVIQALARAAFVGISGDPNFERATTDSATLSTVADLEFDPFDPDDLKRINRTLADNGKCVFLEGVVVRRGDAQRFCNAPGRYQPVAVAEAYTAMPRLDPHGPGVYFRPKMSFRVSVYGRPPHSGAAWRLEQSGMQTFDNMSPVLSLDLTRVAFANKVASFTFADGSLETACVSKGSEALGLADIPLAISRSLVDLPASILQVKIAQTGNSQALVDAQNRVLAVQSAILSAQTSGQPYAGPSGIPTAAPTSHAFLDKDNHTKINLNDNATGFFAPNPAPSFTDATACPSP